MHHLFPSFKVIVLLEKHLIKQSDDDYRNGRHIKRRANGNADTGNHTKAGSCPQPPNHPSGIYNHTGPEESDADHNRCRALIWIDMRCRVSASPAEIS
ncbi:MAG: hypothetical protein P8X85_22345 [Desulfobacterales bacterium]